MLVLEFKIRAKKHQYTAIDEAIRTAQFVQNKCLRFWMDNEKVNKYDLNKYCRVLAHDFGFANKLNSQARQSSTERAWSAISRFYDNIGLDVGLESFYTDHKGHKVENPRFLRKGEAKLKRLQRRLSRKKKGSSNRQKARDRLAKAHLKISRQRKDFAVKLARCVVHSNDVIVYEDLRIKNLVKNHCLAKNINDAAWYQFRGWLEYLGEKHGKITIAVPPHYTSQNCSNCGEKVKKSLSTRTHICACGCQLDRDENAARNILKLGLSTAGHSGTWLQDSLNALGEDTSTFSGEILSKQVTSVNKESPVIATKGARAVGVVKKFGAYSVFAIASLAVTATPLVANGQVSPNGVRTLSPEGGIIPTATWSLGTRAGDFVFVAGMRGIDPETNMLVPDEEGRVRQAFLNMQLIAESEGATLQDAVRLVVYVTDMYRYRPIVNQIQEELWGDGPYPPRTIIEVDRLNQDDIVEVEGTFYAPVEN